MPLRNTLTRFGGVAKFFHWTIVLLIILQYVLMNNAHDLPRGEEKFTLYMLHKSFGITILGLAVVRLLWRWTNPVPPLPNTLRPYEKALARFTHVVLYALIFAMPLSGWIMSSAQNFPVSYFDWFTLPNLTGANRDLGHWMEEVHEWLFNALLAVAVLHVLGALKHHFWLRDDVLKRMLPFAKVRDSRDVSIR